MPTKFQSQDMKRRGHLGNEVVQRRILRKDLKCVLFTVVLTARFQRRFLRHISDDDFSKASKRLSYATIIFVVRV
jgi:hypothetical protein